MNISFVWEKMRTLFLVIMASVLLVSCADEIDVVNDTAVVREATDSVFIYNMYGIARYNYDDNGRIVEILTLDSTTLSPFITDTEKYICEYTYGQDGYISELIYFGNKFIVNKFDGNGRPVSARCDTSEPAMTVNFSYNGDNKIVEEAFYEDNELIQKNTFDNSSKPMILYYGGIGELKFDYYDTETYVTITYLESEEASPDIVLYFDEYGYPIYCTQNVESAVRATTWSYNKNNVCEDTLIESSYDGYFFTEEYMIFHDSEGRISSINLYTPKSDGTPTMSAKYEYKYDADGNAKTQTDTIYIDDNVVSQKVYYEFINGKRGKTTTENYTDGIVESKTVDEREYDSKGRTVKLTSSSYLADGTYSSGKIEEYEYTSSGNVTERITTSYTEGKKLEYVFSEEYEFNDMGLTSRATYKGYDGNKVLVEKEIDEFEYNENKDVTYQTVSIYDDKNALVSKTETVNEYADVGYLKVSTATQYDSDSKVTFSIVTKYDSNGEVTSSTQYDSDGNVVSSTTN